VADLRESTGVGEPADGTKVSSSVNSARDPGWYALGENPNEQSYWDGAQWAGVRHWVAGRGWVESSSVPETATAEPSAAPAPPAPKGRRNANPYAPSRWPSHRVTPSRAPTTFSVGVLLLMVSGIALMYGSVGTWIHVNGTLGIVDFHASVNGIDETVTSLIGVNGWVTFIGGIVLLVFGALALSSEEIQLAVLTTVVAFVVVVFAIFDMFRVVQKISQLPSSASVSVGWGLICVLSAAVLAVLVCLGRLLRRG